MTVEQDREHALAYRLVLPPGWTRLPMERAAMRTAARAWLLRRFAHAPRDRTASLRREITEDLVALTMRTGAEYARMMLVLAADVDSRPISASCLVSVLPHAVSDEAGLQSLARSMAPGADTARVADLGDNRGVLVVRDALQRPAVSVQERAQAESLAAEVVQTLGIEHDQPAEPWEPGLTRHVEVHLPLPDQGATLLLSFATPLAPLFAPLTELFVLMACSVQFDPGDGSWR